MARLGEFVRVVYKGRPVFSGKRDPRTGETLEGGWHIDDISPWTIEWDSRKYELVPNLDTFVPFDVAVCMFGDPRSGPTIVADHDERGQVGFIPDRATEVRRLRTKYDNMFGDDSVILNHPIAEVYELDGTRIVTVLDDPQGETTTPSDRSLRDDNELLAVVRRQQETINQLMDRVGIRPDGSLVNQDSPAPPSPAVSPAPTTPEPVVTSELPEDEFAASPSSEARTGERGGRPAGAPAIDFSTMVPGDSSSDNERADELANSAVKYGPES